MIGHTCAGVNSENGFRDPKTRRRGRARGPTPRAIPVAWPMGAGDKEAHGATGSAMPRSRPGLTLTTGEWATYRSGAVHWSMWVPFPAPCWATIRRILGGKAVGYSLTQNSPKGFLRCCFAPDVCRLNRRRF